eukprot:jgi/Tetstr1/436637/TSEL_025433.t1
MQESSMLTMLLLCSIVEFFAALTFCTRVVCHNYAAWALSAGVVSIVLTGLLIGLLHARTGIYNKIIPYLATFLFVWWIPGAGVTTFSGPFINVGNGYFGAWGAFLSSFLLCHARVAGTDWRSYMDKTMATMKPNKGHSHEESPYPPAGPPAPEAPHFPGPYPADAPPPPAEQQKQMDPAASGPYQSQV